MKNQNKGMISRKRKLSPEEVFDTVDIPSYKIRIKDLLSSISEDKCKIWCGDVNSLVPGAVTEDEESTYNEKIQNLYDFCNEEGCKIHYRILKLIELRKQLKVNEAEVTEDLLFLLSDAILTLAKNHK